MNTLNTIDIKDFLRTAIMGAIVGAIYVGVSYIFSHQPDNGKIIGAAITAAIVTGLAKRGRPAS